jgi:hypothetical protein
MEQVANLLAEEIVEKMAGKQGINEMESMMRELVKEAANVGMQHAIEQGEDQAFGYYYPLVFKAQVEIRQGRAALCISSHIFTARGFVSCQAAG